MSVGYIRKTFVVVPQEKEILCSRHMEETVIAVSACDLEERIVCIRCGLSVSKTSLSGQE